MKHVKIVLVAKHPEVFDQFTSEHLFYNKNICINNQTVYFKNWVENNVLKISQMLKDDGQFLTVDEFQTKYTNIRTNFLSYNGLVNAIKAYMRKMNLVCEPFNEIHDSVGWRIPKNSKHIIKQSLQKKLDSHNSAKKWNNQFQHLDWAKIYFLSYKTSIDTKLRWFQTRLLYRILPTNRYLFLRKIKPHEQCDLCNIETETLEHMFFDCTFINTFWQNLTQKFLYKLPHVNNFQFSKELILFGMKQNVKTDKPINLFILCAKYYIYSCKFSISIPNADVFLKRFKYRYRIEKYLYANTHSSPTTFNTEWLPYLNVIENL